MKLSQILQIFFATVPVIVDEVAAADAAAAAAADIAKFSLSKILLFNETSLKKSIAFAVIWLLIALCIDNGAICSRGRFTEPAAAAACSEFINGNVV